MPVSYAPTADNSILYTSLIERFLRPFRKPLVYLTGIAVLASSSPCYGDSALLKGKDQDLADYVVGNSQLVSEMERAIRLRTPDISNGMEIILNALRCQTIEKKTVQKRNYTEFILCESASGQAREHVIPLSQQVGLQLEGCINSINEGRSCSQETAATYRQECQTQQAQGESVYSQDSAKSEGVSKKQEGRDERAYGRIHASRKGKSGVGAVAVLGAAFALGFLLSRGARAVSGGGGGVGGGAVVGPGFSHGGTGAIPPLPGTGHR